MCEAQRGGERAAGRPCRRPPHVGPSSSCSAGLPPHRLPEPPSTASSAASCGTRGPRTSDALPPEGGCRLPFEASEPVRGDSDGERRGAARGAAPEPHCSTDAKRSVTFTFQLLRKVPDRCRRQGSRGAFSPLDAAPALPPLPLSLLPHLAPQRQSRAHTLHSTPTVRDPAASLWSCAWQPSIAAQAQAGMCKGRSAQVSASGTPPSRSSMFATITPSRVSCTRPHPAPREAPRRSTHASPPYKKIRHAVASTSGEKSMMK